MRTHEHGTWRKYVYDDCRCIECYTAHSKYQKGRIDSFHERQAAGKTNRRLRWRSQIAQQPGTDFMFLSPRRTRRPR